MTDHDPKRQVESWPPQDVDDIDSVSAEGSHPDASSADASHAHTSDGGTTEADFSPTHLQARPSGNQEAIPECFTSIDNCRLFDVKEPFASDVISNSFSSLTNAVVEDCESRRKMCIRWDWLLFSIVIGVAEL